MKKSLFALVCAGMISSAAAVQAGDWDGFQVGAHIGYGHGQYDFYGTDGTDTGDFSGIGANGAAGGLLAGYGKRVKSQGYFGAELDGSISAIDVTGSVNSVSGKVSLENTIGAFAKAGFLPSDDYMIYGKLGYVNSSFEASVGTLKESTRLGGVAVGLGIEGLVSDKLSLRAEYTHTDYSNLSATSGNSTLKVDPNTGVFRVGVAYRF